MKKWFYAVLLIIILLLIITGCGQKADEATPEVKKDKVVSENGSQDSEKDKDKLTVDQYGNYNTDNILPDNKENLEKVSTKYELSPFSGKPVDEQLFQRAVMVSIENTPAARPQSGLARASVIYEFLVEGGITRFLALFWHDIPDKIGPIRSLRPYMIRTALEYNSLLLHAGASPGGFQLLAESDITHLDQIYKGNYYWRSGERRTPHNLYTGEFKIDDYLNNLTGQEYEQRFSFKQISFFDPGDNIAEEIIINYWGNYRVCYRYNSIANNYQRFLNDFNTPHRNDKGNQLMVDNIIVQKAATEVIDDVGRLKIKLSRRGEALIFRDGTVIRGYWQNENSGYTHYYTDEGERVKLNPGQTWIQVVPESSFIDYRKVKDELETGESKDSGNMDSQVKKEVNDTDDNQNDKGVGNNNLNGESDQDE